MKNIIIRWILPTVRQQGGPLAVEEISHVVIELSADNGQSFELVDDFAASVLEAPVDQLPFSDQYIVRGTVVDSAQQPGNSVLKPFVIADDSPPGDLVITVDLS